MEAIWAMERFYLKSFGCKVNQYDGQGLRERLLGAGFEEVLLEEEADLYVLNFCVVTGRSASRCHRFLKGVARRRPDAGILVAGCLAPADREQVRTQFPRAWILPDKAPPEFSGRLALEGDGSGHREGPWETVSGLAGHTRAFLKIQDGCDLGCTYCVIPSIRGKERSRPPEEVSMEAGRLLQAGYKELVLCGIRLGGYRSGSLRLGGLLKKLLEDHLGTFRIRLSSLNPAEVTQGLLDVIQNDPRVARHLHLPLQSGDPEILRSMHRPYSPQSFMEKVREIRRYLDDPAISTDLMVGFPGEDEAAFTSSLRVIEEAGVSRVHVFPYSLREGTPAASALQVPDRVKTERSRVALIAARRLKTAFDQGFIGRKARVLVETGGEEKTARPTGLTSRYQRVSIAGGKAPPRANTFVQVVLEQYDDGLFSGRTVEEENHG